MRKCSHNDVSRLLRCACAALILSAAGTAAAQPKAPAAKAEQEIKSLELELERLIMQGDADGYGKYLADDYVLINAAGSVVTKAQILAALKGGTSSDSLLPSDLHVRIYGETAVLNGHLTWKGIVNGQKLERQSLFTKVFIRRKGKWLMVNNQGTALPQRTASQ